MNVGALIIGAIPAGCLALSLALLLTAPPRFLLATAVCGFAGRLARDLLLGADMGVGWATLLAASVVVLMAAVVIRRYSVPPVVMVSGLLPLGASGATFDTILGFMRLPNLEGEALSAAAVMLISSAARAFLTYLALAVGMYLAITLLRVATRESSTEV